MKKNIFIFVFIFISIFLVFAEEPASSEADKKTDEIESLYLRTGLSFTHFSVNGYKYYDSDSSWHAPEIVEIITVDKDLYKIVYAEPMYNAGVLRYVTVYLEIGDLVAIKLRYSDTVAAGLVLSGKANVIELKGMVKD